MLTILFAVQREINRAEQWWSTFIFFLKTRGWKRLGGWVSGVLNTTALGGLTAAFLDKETSFSLC